MFITLEQSTLCIFFNEFHWQRNYSLILLFYQCTNMWICLDWLYLRSVLLFVLYQYSANVNWTKWSLLRFFHTRILKRIIVFRLNHIYFFFICAYQHLTKRVGVLLCLHLESEAKHTMYYVLNLESHTQIWTN